MNNHSTVNTHDNGQEPNQPNYEKSNLLTSATSSCKIECPY